VSVMAQMTQDITRYLTVAGCIGSSPLSAILCREATLWDVFQNRGTIALADETLALFRINQTRFEPTVDDELKTFV
jgi:hypothetical protein